MIKTRQQILILHLFMPDLDSQTIAWALYDGSLPKGELQMNTGSSYEPPYNSVIEAMQDGWNVIQIPNSPIYLSGFEHTNNYLPYEYVLERKVEIK